MINRPLVSVIIPCWNCAQDIKNMLDMLLAQTYDNWIVYCVDDKSTDNTFQVIKMYGEKDDRIVYFERNRNPKGAQTCRNIGLGLSDGTKYVIWFDADDVIAPYCLEQRVKFMEENPNVDFGVFKAKSFCKDIWEVESTTLFGFQCDYTNDLQNFLRRYLPFVVWNNIYRRDSLIKYKLTWDEKILSLQDADFNIQSILKGLRYRYAVDTKIDYFWRTLHTNNSITQKIDSESHKNSHIYFFNKLCQSLSLTQKRELCHELDEHLFYFIDKFHGDNDFSMKLLDNDVFKNRPLFKFKVWLYNILSLRSKKFLFPMIYFRHRLWGSQRWRFTQKTIKIELGEDNR